MSNDCLYTELDPESICHPCVSFYSLVWKHIKPPERSRMSCAP